MIRIGVFGANGRMGLALLEAATIKEQTQLTGAYVCLLYTSPSPRD